MKSLESVKNLYEKSNEMIIVTNKDLSIVWKSNESLPDFISDSSFVHVFTDAPTMPTSSSKILHYIDGRSVKVAPLFDGDSIEGYMMTFFDADEIETLSDRSIMFKHKQNSLGNIRIAMSSLLARFETFKMQGHSQEAEELYEELCSGFLKMLSANVNADELTRYYSGDFSTELLNISKCLEETADQCCHTLDADDFELVTEIEPVVFMNMNYERLANVIANLVINGYMYCDAHQKKITLKMYKQDDRIFIEVSDNGQSADVELMKEAMYPFRPFKKFRKGEMLGLAVVNKFTEHFKGEMDIVKNDAGLTVRLSFSAEISEAPKSFRLRRIPPAFGGFESIFCILAKGNFKD